MGIFSDILNLFRGKEHNGYSREIGTDYRSVPDGVISDSIKKRRVRKKKSLLNIFSSKPVYDDIYHNRLNLEPAKAFFLICEIRKNRAYTQKEIPREGKNPRIISIPNPFLKNVQRRILHWILDKEELHDAAHGFVKKRSIFTAAEPHTGKRVVIAVDIRNFFDTITSNRVYGVFKQIGFEKKDASALTSLCTYNNSLPQGAPTSPALANLVCRRMDSRLSGLVSKYGHSYTRYADDLFFSGDSKIIRLIPYIKSIVNDEGFETADEKFRIMRSGGRQRILGLNVNSKVSIPRKVRRIIRAMVWEQLNSDTPDDALLDFLYGHVGLMKYSHPSQGRKLKRKLNKVRRRIQ